MTNFHLSWYEVEIKAKCVQFKGSVPNVELMMCKSNSEQTEGVNDLASPPAEEKTTEMKRFSTEMTQSKTQSVKTCMI